MLSCYKKEMEAVRIASDPGEELLQREESNGQTPREEAANTFIHCIGLALSIPGLILLISVSIKHGSPWLIVGSSIFGSCLVNLYLISCLYHGLPWIASKKIFRKLDHISIYLLIAGSYTPYTLTLLRPSVGWVLFGLVWGMAIVGIIFKTFFGYRFRTLATLGYLLMGWLIVIGYEPMILGFPFSGLVWLFVGGLCYTLGAVFYLLDRKVRYFHAIWHVFVLAGSVCHFLSVLWYLIPLALK